MSSPRRIPAGVRDTGDVCLSGPRPTGPHSIAHRITYYPARAARNYRPGERRGQGHMEPRPRCVPVEDITDTYPELSGHRADQLGAQACPTCYPDTTP